MPTTELHTNAGATNLSESVVVSRLLNIQQCREITGISAPHIYKLMKSSNLPFPRPVKLGSKTSRWISVEVKRWVESLPRG